MDLMERRVVLVCLVPLVLQDSLDPEDNLDSMEPLDLQGQRG